MVFHFLSFLNILDFSAQPYDGYRRPKGWKKNYHPKIFCPEQKFWKFFSMINFSFFGRTKICSLGIFRSKGSRWRFFCDRGGDSQEKLFRSQKKLHIPCKHDQGIKKHLRSQENLFFAILNYFFVIFSVCMDKNKTSAWVWKIKKSQIGPIFYQKFEHFKVFNFTWFFIFLVHEDMWRGPKCSGKSKNEKPSKIENLEMFKFFIKNWPYLRLSIFQAQALVLFMSIHTQKITEIIQNSKDRFSCLRRCFLIPCSCF